MQSKKKCRIAAAVLAGTMVLNLVGCGAAPAKQPNQNGHAAQTSVLTLVEGEGSLTNENGIHIEAQTEDRTIAVDKKAGKLHNSEAEIRFDPKNDNEGGMYGIVFRYTEDGEWTFIGQDGLSGKDPVLTSWVVMTSDGAKQKLLTDGQRIYKGRKAPYTFKVRLVDDNVTIYLDNAAIYNGTVSAVTDGTGYTGLCYVNGSGADIQSMTVTPIEALAAEESTADPLTIQSEAMKVTMDGAFPCVLGYELTENGESLSGQNELYRVVEINNTRYTPEVTVESTADQVVYHVNVKEISVSFDVNFQVKGNVLRQEICNVQDTEKMVKTIHFPEQFLVSMDNSAPGAELRVNNYRQESVYALADKGVDHTWDTTTLAVLSNQKIAASINNGNINNRQEVAWQTVNSNGGLYTGLWTNEYQYRGLDDQPLEDLWTEVAITVDRNGDNRVDFQDGAIARRDDIGNPYVGAANNANTMSMIAMDVGSQAQYPFLRILDNIKKFSAATDGFEQMILIKGYQSEGHDASHPDYANISQRAGGEKDLKILLDEAGKYGAKIGLHINHTEAYPEAPQYSEDLVAAVKGWGWYDQSYHIIRENDIMDTENGAEKRLDDLASIVGDKLSFVYVDTYQDSRWQAERLAKKISDLGWMLGTEYSEELVKRSTWSHTINSTRFNYDTPGNLVRFVENENKDIFAASPLFRGLENRNKKAGFLGWQRCWSMDTTLETFYTQVLPQKYLANFPVNSWKAGNLVKLGNENQVVSQIVAGVNQITKDGRLVADGNKIFIPWNPQEETKIYHWNQEGGTTTWQLPVSWEKETQVKFFRLSDEGRTELKVLPVQDGTVTLTADAKTGYVLYKGSDDIAETDLTTYEWGKGSQMKDMGFDSHTFGYAWEKNSSAGSTSHIYFENNAPKGAAEIDYKDNQTGNTHVHVKGGKDAVLSQTMTGLEPGETYTISAFMEANEGRRLSISVTTPDGKTVENYVDSYTVPFGVTHNDRSGTMYQRVKLNFTQSEGSDTAEVRLTAASDSSADAWANFDNVRIVAVGELDAKGHDYYENFEQVDQGYGPFTSTLIADQCHLSEANGEWTHDVIDGRYSLKIRGNTDEPEMEFEHLRTVPHRLRLAPNTTYTMGMDFMMTDSAANDPVKAGEEPLFVLMVRSDKAEAAGDKDAIVLKEVYQPGDTTVQNLKDLTFTTGNYDDYYVDLYDASYMHEFVVDNFYVDQK